MLRQTSVTRLSLLASIWLPLGVLAQAQVATTQAYLATTTIWETVWTVCGGDENTSSDCSSPSSPTVCASCLPLSRRPFDLKVKRDEDTDSLGLQSSLPMNVDQDQSTSGTSANTSPSSPSSSPASPTTSSGSISIPGFFNGVLTGITVASPSSPTSCYALPTPTSELDMVAFSTNSGGGAGTGSSSSNNSPLFLYFGDDATSPEYVGTLVDGRIALLDLSSASSAAGQVAMVLGDGSSVVFDKDGMQLFDATCDTVSSIAIERFWEQVVSVAESPPDTTALDSSTSSTATPSCPESASPTASSSSLDIDRGDLVILPRRSKRQATEPGSRETRFIVQVRVNTTLSRRLRSPSMKFGPSGCTFSTRLNVTAGHNQTFVDLRWTCEHPGNQSAEKHCEDALNAWLGGPPPVSQSPSSSSSSPTPSSTGPTTSATHQRTDFLSFLSPVVSGAGSQLSGLVSPGLVNSTLLQQGMAFLGKANQVISSAVSFGGSSLCQVLHAYDEYDLIFSDPALSSPHTVGAYVSPPADIISENLVPPTTSPSREPRRACQPGVTGFPTAKQTVFPPLIFTGLPGLGGLIPIAEVSGTPALVPSSKSDAAPITSVGVMLNQGESVSSTAEVPVVTQGTKLENSTATDDKDSRNAPLLAVTTAAATDSALLDTTADGLLTETGIASLATNSLPPNDHTEEGASESGSALLPSSTETSSPTPTLTPASALPTTASAPVVVGGATKASAAAFSGDPASMLSLFSWQSSSMASSLLAHRPSDADASPALSGTDSSFISVTWSNPSIESNAAHASAGLSSETPDQISAVTSDMAQTSSAADASLGFEGSSIEATSVGSQTGLFPFLDTLPPEPGWKSSSQVAALPTTSNHSLASHISSFSVLVSTALPRPQATTSSNQKSSLSGPDAIQDSPPRTLTMGANGTSETIVVVAVETATVFPSDIRNLVAEA